MKTRNVAVEKSRAAGGRPARRAETLKKPLLARDLMTHPVRQVQAATPVRDAAAFLVRHGISGAPVLDEHGRWVGVFTQNDLARYARSRSFRGRRSGRWKPAAPSPSRSPATWTPSEAPRCGTT